MFDFVFRYYFGVLTILIVHAAGQNICQPAEDIFEPTCEGYGKWSEWSSCNRSMFDFQVGFEKVQSQIEDDMGCQPLPQYWKLVHENNMMENMAKAKSFFQARGLKPGTVKKLVAKSKPKRGKAKVLKEKMLMQEISPKQPKGKAGAKGGKKRSKSKVKLSKGSKRNKRQAEEVQVQLQALTDVLDGLSLPGGVSYLPFDDLGPMNSTMGAMDAILPGDYGMPNNTYEYYVKVGDQLNEVMEAMSNLTMNLSMAAYGMQMSNVDQQTVQDQMQRATSNFIDKFSTMLSTLNMGEIDMGCDCDGGRPNPGPDGGNWITDKDGDFWKEYYNQGSGYTNEGENESSNGGGDGWDIGAEILGGLMELIDILSPYIESMDLTGEGSSTDFYEKYLEKFEKKKKGEGSGEYGGDGYGYGSMNGSYGGYGGNEGGYGGNNGFGEMDGDFNMYGDVFDLIEQISGDIEYPLEFVDIHDEMSYEKYMKMVDKNYQKREKKRGNHDMWNTDNRYGYGVEGSGDRGKKGSEGRSREGSGDNGSGSEYGYEYGEYQTLGDDWEEYYYYEFNHNSGKLEKYGQRWQYEYYDYFDDKDTEFTIEEANVPDTDWEPNFACGFCPRRMRCCKGNYMNNLDQQFQSQPCEEYSAACEVPPYPTAAGVSSCNYISMVKNLPWEQDINRFNPIQQLSIKKTATKWQQMIGTSKFNLNCVEAAGVCFCCCGNARPEQVDGLFICRQDATLKGRIVTSSGGTSGTGASPGTSSATTTGSTNSAGSNGTASGGTTTGSTTSTGPTSNGTTSGGTTSSGSSGSSNFPIIMGNYTYTGNSAYSYVAKWLKTGLNKIQFTVSTKMPDMENFPEGRWFGIGYSTRSDNNRMGFMDGVLARVVPKDGSYEFTINDILTVEGTRQPKRQPRQLWPTAPMASFSNGIFVLQFERYLRPMVSAEDIPLDGTDGSINGDCPFLIYPYSGGYTQLDPNMGWRYGMHDKTPMVSEDRICFN